MLHKLPFVILKPGSRPVTENLRDVRALNFLKKTNKPCCIHGNGALARKSESKALKLSIRNVVHIKMQFRFSWSKCAVAPKVSRDTGPPNLETVKTFCNQRLAHLWRIR